MRWQLAWYWLTEVKGIMDEQVAILVYVQEGIPETMIRDILLGIEEEGIPYRVSAFQETSANRLGHRASLDSRLDVGIGLSVEGGCSLHHAKIDQDHPVLKLSIRNSDLRNIGTNSARLVKGIPMTLKGDPHERSVGLD
jgi:hypothetical protein